MISNEAAGVQMIRFVRTIGKAEERSTYLNLTDDSGTMYGKDFHLSHKEKVVVIDADGRCTRAQMHNSNQLWGSLSRWYESNMVAAGTQVRVEFDRSELKDGLHVVHLILLPKPLSGRDAHIHGPGSLGPASVNAPEEPATIFSTLAQLEELLQTALEREKLDASHGFEAGNFEAVNRAAEKGKSLTELLGYVERIELGWRDLGLDVTLPPAKPIARLRKGVKTPETDYHVPILEALVAMGGQGKTQDVLDRVGQGLQGQLKPVDWETLSDGRTIRWRNAAQWARNSMVEAGFLSADSARGVWEITQKGRDRLRKLSKPMDET